MSRVFFYISSFLIGPVLALGAWIFATVVYGLFDRGLLAYSAAMWIQTVLSNRAGALALIVFAGVSSLIACSILFRQGRSRAVRF